MDDSLSSLHIESNRGINNVILSIILLSIASTRSDINKFIARTLLSIQQKKLQVCIKSVIDDAIRTLLEKGIIGVKKTRCSGLEEAMDVDYIYPSQQNLDEIMPLQPQKRCFVNVEMKTELELSKLGRAAMKGTL